ncbi:hypothetical protein [Thalassospira lucentensis]|uniref:hypothetical protein n=1 Tax=Thalassospira lucentensis TaxID=168935 RepID=UPI00142D4C6E|nr:hypothetical protein [Thalassospira lucentensis]NIZ03398.1 hypothetical protein [Thalassospira lucentensis]
MAPIPNTSFDGIFAAGAGDDETFGAGDPAGLASAFGAAFGADAGFTFALAAADFGEGVVFLTAVFLAAAGLAEAADLTFSVTLLTFSAFGVVFGSTAFGVAASFAATLWTGPGFSDAAKAADFGAAGSTAFLAGSALPGSFASETTFVDEDDLDSAGVDFSVAATDDDDATAPLPADFAGSACGASLDGGAAAFSPVAFADLAASRLLAAASISEDVITVRFAAAGSDALGGGLPGACTDLRAALEGFRFFPEAFGLETAIAPTSCLSGFAAQYYVALQHNPRWNTLPTSRTL